MELKHNFSVPTGIAETWQHFGDPQGLAECFPGAQVTGVDGDSFTGTAKIKLGPIALVYTGTGEYAERDESAHRLVVNAKGKDKRGNGTAGATVTVQLSEAGADRTDVDVTTDLNVTGKPAQFGRGMIQDVSDKLLGQFVQCLEQKLTAEDSDTESEDSARSPGEEAAPSRSLSEERSDESKGESDPGAPSEAGTEQAEQVPPPARSIREDSPIPMNEEQPKRAASDRAQESQQGQKQQDKQDDSLDLGATVLPILVKNYWREGLIAILGLLVLRNLFRK
ncbi:carbon monoxide dehydrogenase [Enemella dayhoffiae]|uniref:Carbon monoxide dehydrogenase n=1 Tax=Enemella dayhoffiae TaxID=2016507 RepID=A0A255H1S1_9ACTN|nr:SRPBCC family protein [Enemella dayhoffiae]OYO21655.1 carbon monoxide dehydrogenase [Enemella dayhoffiae]